MKKFPVLLLCLLLCFGAAAEEPADIIPEEAAGSHGKVLFIAYSVSGGMENESYSLTLTPEGVSGSVLAVHEYSGKEYRAELGWQALEDLTEYLERMRPESWASLPESEIFALDAPTTSVAVLYEDGEAYSLSDSKEGDTVREVLDNVRCFLESYLKGERETFTVTCSSFDGGGPSYRPVISEPEKLAWNSFRIDADDYDPMATGSGFEVEMVFTGRIPGTVEVYIEETSGMMEPAEERLVYVLEIDEDLNVRLLEEKTEPV